MTGSREDTGKVGGDPPASVDRGAVRKGYAAIGLLLLGLTIVIGALMLTPIG